MKDKGIFLGAKGQKLDDKLKEKLAAAVKRSIEMYEIYNFYFFNEPEGDEDENEMFKNAVEDNRKISEYIAELIKDYKNKNTEIAISTAILVARPNDKNFNAEFYDEVIQGYLIYGDELEDENSLDAYTLRDGYLAENIDAVLWYSNKILTDTSNFIHLTKADIYYV